MQFMRYYSIDAIRYLFAVLMLFAISGCAVKFVADYDAVAFEEILKVGKKVDRFYGELLEAKPTERLYQKYSSHYVEIESDIQSLITRNKVRSLNEESIQISESILKMWLKYKEAHKAKDAYSDGNAKLDRSRFIRLFTAAASAERAKNLDADDKDPAKDSK